MPPPKRPTDTQNTRGSRATHPFRQHRGSSHRHPRSRAIQPQDQQADLAEPRNSHLGQNLRFLPASISPIPSQTSSSKNNPSSDRPFQSTHHTRRRMPPIGANRRGDSHNDVAVCECPICTLPVKASDKMWSCETCAQAFHLPCAALWAGKFADTGNWRCPGCNDSLLARPTEYRCWCKKEIDPQPVPGIPPHSCGQTCGSKRGKVKICQHPCVEICHAGLCPPCAGPERVLKCHCGKKSEAKRCADLGDDLSWSCGEPCGMKTCSTHTCNEICHSGAHGPCSVTVEISCFCGENTKTVPCYDLQHNGKLAVSPSFTCDSPGEVLCDCGEHRRSDVPCAPREKEATYPCPQSPDSQNTCACGRTPISELLSKPRTRCTDPVPLCEKFCSKSLPLPCRSRHPCQQPCHIGPCPPCTTTFTLPCLCSRESFTFTCEEGGMDSLPRCQNPCGVEYLCDVHKCERICCEESAWAERGHCARRLLHDRKWKCEHVEKCDLSGPLAYSESHQCNRLCERTLLCGHNCSMPCHKGPCGTCVEYVHEDVTCFCGRRFKKAPQLCSVRPWACGGLCTRSEGTCSHPMVKHQCHDPDKEACPKCPYLVTKKCACGKKEVNNRVCGLSVVSCGLKCGKGLGCGLHSCRKTCHQDGRCEDKVAGCPQVCGRVKTCGHDCALKCHGESVCDPKAKCKSLVLMKCACSHIMKNIPCSDCIPDTNLPCDTICAEIERNRQLVETLQVQDSNITSEHPYSEGLLKYYTLFPTWANEQEDVVRSFVADPLIRQLNFLPMKSNRRAFLHVLAGDLGLESRSADWEPNRHAQLFKKAGHTCGPIPTLAQALKASQEVEAGGPSKDESKEESAEKGEGKEGGDEQGGVEEDGEEQGEQEDGWTTVKKGKGKRKA